MSTYKVIQDVEAEDKLVGPLSLRQFIYAIIVVVLGFIMFKLAMINPLLALPFLPPAILFAVLAAPFGHDQSSEVWLLAKIRFFLKPRTRTWNQSGLQELVTITAPKKVERALTNGLNPYQVESRLQALAQTIDTRGWAVKGVNVNMFAAPAFAPAESDRLVGPDNFAAPVPDINITSQDDILDAVNSPVAQQVDQLMRASTEAHRQELMNRMSQATQTPPAPNQTQQLPPMFTQPAPAPALTSAYNYQQSTVITSDPVAALPPASPVSQPSAADEAALLEKVHKDALKNKHAAYGHMKVLETSQEKAEREAKKHTTQAAKLASETPLTQEANTDILKLANNDDLTVATIARQAHKNDQPPQDEVVISLR